MIVYINARLNAWAEWHARRGDSGLGFPRECSYTRLQARSGSGFKAEVDDAAWETHRGVNALIIERRAAVFSFYVRRGLVIQKARDCGCSVATLYRRIDAAHQDLLGWLNDEAAGLHQVTYSSGPCIPERLSV